MKAKAILNDGLMWLNTRCYLFLVNYARMKPDIALKALPILLTVQEPMEWLQQQLTDF